MELNKRLLILLLLVILAGTATPSFCTENESTASESQLFAKAR